MRVLRMFENVDTEESEETCIYTSTTSYSTSGSRVRGGYRSLACRIPAAVCLATADPLDGKGSRHTLSLCLRENRSSCCRIEVLSTTLPPSLDRVVAVEGK